MKDTGAYCKKLENKSKLNPKQEKETNVQQRITERKQRL
jgi:hypothetical protein